jgi:hypothetical protein
MTQDESHVSFVTEFFVPQIQLSTKLTEPQGFSFATDTRSKRRRTIEPKEDDALQTAPSCKKSQNRRKSSINNDKMSESSHWRPTITVPQGFTSHVEARLAAKPKQCVKKLHSTAFSSIFVDMNQIQSVIWRN